MRARTGILIVAVAGTATAQTSAAANVTASNGTTVTYPAANGTAGWNPSASTNPGTNPLIPTSLSADCQSFLARMNANPGLSTCTSSLVSATSRFASGSASDVSASDVQGALDTLCNGYGGCGPSLIRDVLDHFAGNCSQELAAGQEAVRASYDILYVLNPFKTALCSKSNSTGSYCISDIASGAIKSGATTSSHFSSIVESASSSSQLVLSYTSSLARRALGLVPRQSQAASGNATLLPNTTTYVSSNLAFLFLQPDLPASALCTPCTQEVLAAYVAWEMAAPYPTGLNSSGLLQGQLGLWGGIQGQCGNGFTSSIEAQAGSDVNKLTSGGAGRFQGVPVATAAATAFGLVAALMF